MRTRTLQSALALLILLLPVAAIAVNLPHYDLDSLVYLSTDIVLADISKDSRGNFTATVTEVLYGSLDLGAKLDTLTPFLMFFRPLDNGQKVILFLDRRPRQYDFFHQDAAKSPFAVPPSGIYLIDGYGHVHEYFQQNNPGPYVAQGYMFYPERVVPTEKDNLALPSLEDVKGRIAATVERVIPIRGFLDQPTTAADVPVLMKLFSSRPRDPETCRVAWPDAIASDIVEKIRSRDDLELLLRISHLHTVSPLPVKQAAGNVDQSATAARIRLLIQTMGDRNRDVPVRVASAQIFLNLGTFHKDWLASINFHKDWLGSSADEIVATARAIFNNPAEDPDLRALSLRFLNLNSPSDLASIRRVYRQTQSPNLQFEIEQAFLEVSDELYQSLTPSSGPVASIIQLAPENGCVQPPDNRITFLTRFHSTRSFNERGSVVTAGRVAFKNTESGQRFELKNGRSLGFNYGFLDGVFVFSLDQFSDLPAGEYTLGMEYAHQFNHLPSAGDVNDVPSVGHTVTVTVTDSLDGKRLSVPVADRK
jgi:hypothetical protein